MIESGQALQFPKLRRPKTKIIKSIVVNISETQYEIVQQVCSDEGWRLEFNRDGMNWDLKWSDMAVSTDVLSRMVPYQKINHFPGMNTISRKNYLTKNIQRMRQNYPLQYDFYPRTFLLPHESHNLKNYSAQMRKKNILKTFIVKPEASAQGRGIFLTQNLNEIQMCANAVVQKYIPNVLLYKGLKFDLRIYALVAGCDPLRIYIYNEGLVRFATHKYQLPSEDNMDDMCMHLTNYAINKNSPHYLFNQSQENLSYGHKKSLAEFFQTLKAMGFKANQYWSDIKNIIVKTMLSGQPHLSHEYRMAQPQNLANDMCFQILGFDFMIDNNHKSYLLEINHTPSFSTQTPLDQLIKQNLIRDTLKLVKVDKNHRQQIIEYMKQQQQKRVYTGKVDKLSPLQRNQKIKILQQERDIYEKNHLGSFEKIYPSQNINKQTKYQELLEFSNKSYIGLTGPKNHSNKSPNKFRIKRIPTIQTTCEEEIINDPQINYSNKIIQKQQKQYKIHQPNSNKKKSFNTNNTNSTNFNINSSSNYKNWDINGVSNSNNHLTHSNIKFKNNIQKVREDLSNKQLCNFSHLNTHLEQTTMFSKHYQGIYGGYQA